MIQDILICGVAVTIFFLINLRIFWFFKVNKDPLRAVTNWLDENDADKKINDAFLDRG